MVRGAGMQVVACITKHDFPAAQVSLAIMAFAMPLPHHPPGKTDPRHSRLAYPARIDRDELTDNRMNPGTTSMRSRGKCPMRHPTIRDRSAGAFRPARTASRSFAMSTAEFPTAPEDRAANRCGHPSAHGHRRQSGLRRTLRPVFPPAAFGWPSTSFPIRARRRTSCTTRFSPSGKKRPGFEPARGSAFSWAVTLTRNRSIDRLRTRRRRADLLEKSVPADLGYNENPTDGATEQAAAGDEAAVVLQGGREPAGRAEARGGTGLFQRTDPAGNRGAAGKSRWEPSKHGFAAASCACGTPCLTGYDRRTPRRTGRPGRFRPARRGRKSAIRRRDGPQPRSCAAASRNRAPPPARWRMPRRESSLPAALKERVLASADSRRQAHAPTAVSASKIVPFPVIIAWAAAACFAVGLAVTAQLYIGARARNAVLADNQLCRATELQLNLAQTRLESQQLLEQTGTGRGSRADAPGGRPGPDEDHDPGLAVGEFADGSRRLRSGIPLTATRRASPVASLPVAGRRSGL